MTRSPHRLKSTVRDTVNEQVRDLPLHAIRLAMFGVGRALLLTDRVTRDYKDLRETGVAPVLGRLREDAQHTAAKVVGQVVRLRGGEDAEPAGSTAFADSFDDAPAERPKPRVNSSLAAGDDGEIAIGKPTAAAAPTPAPATPTAKTTAKPTAKTAAKTVEPEISVGKPVATPAPSPEPATKATPKPAPRPTPAPSPDAGAKSAPKAADAPSAKATKADSADKITSDSLPVPNYDGLTLASVRARLRALSAAQVTRLRKYEETHAARPEFLKMFDNRIAKLAEQG